MPTDSNALIPSPFVFHVLLASVTFIGWLFVVRMTINDDTYLSKGKSKKIFFLTTIVFTSVGFSVILFDAFIKKEIAGYQPKEEWQWLDTQYSYEAIYKGEWLAFFFLYFSPLLMSLIFSFLLADNEREKLGRELLRSYPVIIFTSYIIFFSSAAIFSLDTSRYETEPTEYEMPLNSN